MKNLKPKPTALPLPPEPQVGDIFRRLEMLERESESSVHTGQNRWMLPYADLLTLLLGLFLLLLTASKMEIEKLQAVNKPGIQQTLKKTQTVPKKQKQVAALSASRLQQQLKAGLHMNGVDVREQARGVVISLKDTILFAPGNAELSSVARSRLDRLAVELKKSMNGVSRPIRVEGHTDNTPITTARFPSNWELSTARATNIVRYLVVSHHFSPELLSAAGYGEFKPLENNSSIEGKQKNRRVDIVILSENMARQEPPALEGKTPQPAGKKETQED